VVYSAGIFVVFVLEFTPNIIIKYFCEYKHL